MPDNRLLHCCQGFSNKLASLDHLAYRVWTQYLLSADDFGVCPDSAALIRGANLALTRETENAIASAIDALVQVGLVLRFAHQGQTYLCSHEWQDYQSIRWPRTTYYPMPSAEVLPKFSRSTSELLKKHSARKRAPGSTSSRPNHRLTANGKRLTAKSTESDPVAPAVEDFDAFWEAWPAGHRVNRKQAAEQWRKLPAEDRVSALQAVKWRVDHDTAWQGPREDGRWAIPHPFRYLRDQRFTDAQLMVLPVVDQLALTNAAADKALVDEGLRILAARKAMR